MWGKIKVKSCGVSLISFKNNCLIIICAEGNDVTNEEKDSGEKKSNGGVAEREDDLGELIIAPLAYHVSLMGDPVERIWIGVNYISPYSQKQVK